MKANFKPFLFILLCSTLLVAGISFFSYSQSKSILKEKMTLSAQQMVMQSVDKLNLTLRGYEDLTYNFITDSMILSNLADYSSNSSGQLERYTASNAIKTTIAVRFFSKGEITAVHLLPRDSDLKVITTTPPDVPSIDYTHTAWYKQALAGGRIVWHETKSEGYMSGLSSFAISRNLTLSSGRQYLLLVEISTRVLNDTLSERRLGGSGEMVLLDGNNRLLSAARGAGEGEVYGIPALNRTDIDKDASLSTIDTATIKVNGTQQLIVAGKLSTAGWKVEAVIPVSELVKDTRKIRNTTLASVLTIAIVTYLLNYLYQRRRSEARIRYMAYHDHLTDLANRKLFNELLEKEIVTAKQHGQRFAVLFIDLDRLKIINDTFGHGAGDKLLIDISDKLKRHLNKAFTIARFGGDEFLVLMPQISEYDEVETVIYEIAALIQQPIYYQDKELFVSASIGVSIYPQHGEDGQSLIKNADMAMYSVKESGRSSHRLYDAAMDKKSYGNLSLERDLRKALEREQLLLMYQPQYELATGRIAGVEALVRWRHHEHGLISPADFIPIAEDSRLIIPIGEWILYTACKQNKAWQDAGLPAVQVSVNLSIHQFQCNGIIETVSNILQQTGLLPQYLELEITESIAMQDVEKVILTLQGLSKLGVKISIDDFGTGYSSLSYLKNFPIHRLKIDKSFLDDMIENPKERAIVGAIIVMSHSLNLCVTAEGVETMEQVKLLSELNCDDVQGYIFSRPLLPEECANRLVENVSFAGRRL
ncbi:bifunctional diguanylate cyclase/phosphodiesterase [Paenibacillus sp. CF384]|uniref:putative bifunctional diguanylate cyclase/phosphodiesterase n=1 Tax=Paenibacillus sp. CF384 TaxID=1884382 RepID=UPI00089B3F53|nr:EAL domain-containing protein [Paenibacillus sp. CF384]SDX33464.1 diguanylate cyclase (GGDEF) domain-containing protein [Paenibacillus sp. CF384]